MSSPEQSGFLVSGQRVFSREGWPIDSSFLLAQSAVPVCLAPNGTVATNGVITLGTALVTTYSGGIWLRLPAGAVSGGAAGLYWAVMTSTTQGQIYTNFADPASEFIPRIPTGALVAAVGSNVAYTQTTSETTLINATIPGGSLGSNGSFRVRCAYNGVGAGTKIPRGKLNGTTVINAPNVTAGGQGIVHTVTNRGVSNRQYAPNGGSGDTGAYGAQGYFTNDSTANMSYTFTATLAAATDCFVIEVFSIDIFPS